MSKENIDMDGANEPLTKQEDGLGKVQFTSSPVSIQIDGKPTAYVRSGLSKEELMKFANDPFWTRLRTLLFVLFWVIWFAMLIGAVVIIIVAPKCPASSRLKWYQKADMCRLTVDENSRNTKHIIIEEFMPMIEKIKSIEFDTIVLPPMHNRTNFMDVDEQFGTMNDFEKFIKKTAGLNVIMEFDFVTTTKDHDWYQAALRNDSEYMDYYVWSKSSQAREAVQSNEGKVFLNIMSSSLQERIKNILYYWHSKGLRGFSLLSVDALANLNVHNRSDIAMVIKDIRDYTYTKIDPKGKTALLVTVDEADALQSFVGTEEINIADLAVTTFSVQPEAQVETGNKLHEKFHRIFGNLPKWDTTTKVGPWVGLTIDMHDNTKSRYNYIEMMNMAIYMHQNCTPIPIIGNHTEIRTIEHLKILNKYRHEHIESMLMGKVSYPAVSDTYYSTTREYPENEGLLLVVNFREADPIKLVDSKLPKQVDLLINSMLLNATGTFNVEEGFKLDPFGAMLYKYTPPSHN